MITRQAWSARWPNPEDRPSRYRAVGLGAVSTVIEWSLPRTLADRFYPWIVRHRHEVPRWVSHLLFETAIRRAAQRAAAEHCTPDGACRR